MESGLLEVGTRKQTENDEKQAGCRLAVVRREAPAVLMWPYRRRELQRGCCGGHGCRRGCRGRREAPAMLLWPCRRRELQRGCCGGRGCRRGCRGRREALAMLLWPCRCRELQRGCCGGRGCRGRRSCRGTYLVGVVDSQLTAARGRNVGSCWV